MTEEDRNTQSVLSETLNIKKHAKANRTPLSENTEHCAATNNHPHCWLIILSNHLVCFTQPEVTNSPTHKQCREKQQILTCSRTSSCLAFIPNMFVTSRRVRSSPVLIRVPAEWQKSSFKVESVVRCECVAKSGHYRALWLHNKVLSGRAARRWCRQAAR